MHMITTSFLVAVLFFGGWHVPVLTEGSGIFASIVKVIAILLKGSFFIFFYVWVRWTLPRFRYDQLMGIAWRVLIPLSVVYLVIVMILREADMPLVALTAVSVILLAGAAAVAARRPKPPVIQKTGRIHPTPEVSRV
jgi:NADH-quinone oxidoreductase subunit H